MLWCRILFPFQVLIKHCLGDRPRNCMPIDAEAKLLGMSRGQLLGPKLVDLGACVYVASCSFVTSFLSFIMWAIEEKKIKPDMIATLDSYDETSLTARAMVESHNRRIFIGDHQSRMLTDSVGPEEPQDDDGEYESGLYKFIQADCWLLVTYVVLATGRFVALQCPVLQPLQVADRCTGPVLFKCKNEWYNASLLKAVQQRFPFVASFTTPDGAGSNNRAEETRRMTSPGSAAGNWVTITTANYRKTLRDTAAPCV